MRIYKGKNKILETKEKRAFFNAALPPPINTQHIDLHNINTSTPKTSTKQRIFRTKSQLDQHKKIPKRGIKNFLLWGLITLYYQTFTPRR